MEEEYTTRSSKGHQVSVSSLAVFKPNLLIKPRRSAKSNFHRVKSSLRVAVLSPPPRETFHLGGEGTATRRQVKELLPKMVAVNVKSYLQS